MRFRRKMDKGKLTPKFLKTFQIPLSVALVKTSKVGKHPNIDIGLFPCSVIVVVVVVVVGAGPGRSIITDRERKREREREREREKR